MQQCIESLTFDPQDAANGDRYLVNTFLSRALWDVSGSKLQLRCRSCRLGT